MKNPILFFGTIMVALPIFYVLFAGFLAAITESTMCKFMQEPARTEHICLLVSMLIGAALIIYHYAG